MTAQKVKFNNLKNSLVNTELGKKILSVFEGLLHGVG